MVLAIAVPLAITSSILVLRLPPVYMAKAEIEINPPAIDPELSTLVTHEPGRHDPSVTASYVPNHEARLRSKGLAEKVVNDPSIAAEMASTPTRPSSSSSRSTCCNSRRPTLHRLARRHDPALTKKLLEMLLIQFQNEAKKENDDKLDDTAEYARDNLDETQGRVEANFDEADRQRPSRKSNTIGPGGRSILEEQYVNLGSIMSQKTIRARRAPAADDDVPDVSQVRVRPRSTQPGGADRRAEPRRKDATRAFSKTCASTSAISTTTRLSREWPSRSTTSSTSSKS